MLVESRTVSRKTPTDGRLEITRVGAARLGGIGDGFELFVGDESAPARLGTMECTCRGPERPHVHYFLESPALKRLEPGTNVDLELEPTGNRIRVSPTSTDVGPEIG
jgi:hypothetical protein